MRPASRKVRWSGSIALAHLDGDGPRRTRDRLAHRGRPRSTGSARSSRAVPTPPPLRVTLGTGQAEVEVDVIATVFADQQMHCARGRHGVDAVELDRTRRLTRAVLDQSHRERHPLDQGPGGDHLADVEAVRPRRSRSGVAILTAQSSERAVGDAGHRCQHHRGVDGVATDVQRGQKSSHGVVECLKSSRRTGPAGVGAMPSHLAEQQITEIRHRPEIIVAGSP